MSNSKVSQTHPVARDSGADGAPCILCVYFGGSPPALFVST